VATTPASWRVEKATCAKVAVKNPSYRPLKTAINIITAINVQKHFRKNPNFAF